MAEVNGELRAYEWRTHRIKSYTHVYVYIIDDINEDHAEIPPVLYPTVNEKALRCAKFKDLFDDFTDADYCTSEVITIKPGETQQAWTAYWAEVLGSLTENDLLLITSAGDAYGWGRNYMWRFRDNPDHPINATRFIRQINRTHVDCMLILDCFVPTRWPTTKLWKRSHAMTEIIAMPAEMRCENGPVQHTGAMQTSVVRNLASYAANSSAHSVVGDIERMCSVPELMAMCGDMYSHTTRVWTAKPCRKPDPRHEAAVWRIVLDPFVTADTQMLRFYGMHVCPDPDRLRAVGVPNAEIIGDNFDDEDFEAEDEEYMDGSEDDYEDDDEGDDEDEDEDEGIFMQ